MLSYSHLFRLLTLLSRTSRTRPWRCWCRRSSGPPSWRLARPRPGEAVSVLRDVGDKLLRGQCEQPFQARVGRGEADPFEVEGDESVGDEGLEVVELEQELGQFPVDASSQQLFFPN